MAVKFNPFSGQLQIDEKGSGGASYIDGEVATYNDLPLSSTTAPLDTAWLVRGSSGVWPFTKPGGVYIRTATGGSSRDADYTYAGVFPDVFSDANFTLYDEADTSKNLKFQLSGIPTATTHTVDAPAGSGRMLVEGQSIGSTTAAAGTFTTLTANNGTLTASAPVLDLSQTWNNASVAFTGLKSNVTATAAASNSMFADIQAGGYSQFGIARISSTSNAVWLYNTNSGTNTNGVGANYERGFMRWSSNVLQIGSEKLGTGSARALELQTDGTTRLTISAGGAVTAGGTLIGGPIQSNSHVRVAAVSQLEFGSGGSRISNQSSGVLTLHDSALSDFGRLQFGGTTSSFPALKRSSTTLQVRLADDSADAPLSCGAITASGDANFGGGVAQITSAGQIRLSSGTGNVVLRRGDGVTFFTGNYNTFVDFQAPEFRLGHSGTGGPVSFFCEGSDIFSQRRSTAGQTLRLYNTWSSATSFERLNIRWATNECIIDAEAGSGGGTLRGIKLGSATSSLLGFYGATPVDRPATVADPTGGGTIDAEARTAINDIIDRLQELGLIA